MVRVWKVTNWTEVHDRMKEGERIYSDKFPIANVTGTWQVAHTYLHNAKQACIWAAVQFLKHCLYATKSQVALAVVTRLSDHTR